MKKLMFGLVCVVAVSALADGNTNGFEEGEDENLPTFHSAGRVTNFVKTFAPASTVDITLAWDDNVSAVSYTIDAVTVDVDDLSTGSQTIDVTPGTVVTVHATAKDWFTVAEGTGDMTVDEEKTVGIRTEMIDTLADVGIENIEGVSVADVKEWADEKELTPEQIATCDFAFEAYLMNIDLSAKPELAIVSIAEAEGDWMITVKASAGEADIDLGNIHGTLKVKAAATLDELATAEPVAYDIDVREECTVIKVPGENKNFMKATVTP